MDQIDDVREVTVMDLDLNQEPLDSSTGSGSGSRLGSLLNELEIAHGQIEERIRQLEAVTDRARERQRWRQARNPPETVDVMIEITDHAASNEGPIQNLEAAQDERHKSWLKDSSSDLVAKALKLDMDLANAVGDGGGFFDCNICLEMAREPILTCCGHLFCWACFYQLPYDVYSTAKECPVCKGEVADASITPIYGNGNVDHVPPELESGLKVPPRPRARRVESVRQQRVNRRLSHVPVAEALRRIRMGMGITRERPHRLNNSEVGSSVSDGRNNVAPVRVSPLEVLPNPTEVGGSQGLLRSRQFSSVLSESADSLLSISSALNNAERLVDDLESYIHNRVGGSNHEHVLSFGGVSDDPSISSTDVMIPPQEQTIGPNSSLPLASSSSRGRLGMLHHEHLSRDPSSSEMNVADHRPSTSSSRRRLRLSRVADVDHAFSREPQRRRLG